MKDRFIKATQQEVADVLGISRQSLNMKMNGKRDFKLEEVDRLFNEYGISIHELKQIMNEKKEGK